MFRARGASKTGRSKKSRLEDDVGAIVDPERPPKSSKSGRAGRLISKISSVRSFRPLRPVGLVSSRRLGRPGGAALNRSGEKSSPGS